MSIAYSQCKVPKCSGAGYFDKKYRVTRFPGGYCNAHYLRKKRGVNFDHSRYEPNEVRVKAEVAYITLCDITAKPVAAVTIDKSDLPLVRGYRWYLSAKRYAVTHTKEGQIAMHRLIAGWSTDDSPYIDHKNGNGLDNRRDNLRQATASQNCANSKKRRNNKSGYMGVSWDKERQLWEARLYHRQIRYSLGRYKSADEAARSYDAKKIELCGEFARLNFPIEK